jgi:chromosome partitioning protein
MRDWLIIQIYWISDMTAKIITVAQQKGGAGKTTVAVHLAIAFLEQGLRVAVVDIDPQESLVNWFRQRGPSASELGPNVKAAQGWRVESEVRALAREHDVIIIDSPPHAETEAKIAMRSADLVIVPLQPSPMDLWATGKTIEQVAAQGSRGLLVLNRVPARARIAEEMTKATRNMGAEIAHTSLGNRVAFAASLLAGKGVTEAASSSRAAEETRALAQELLDAVAQAEAA